jgi:uncharacterized membrane protein YgaE (UPF0421/DUF939 family)
MGFHEIRHLEILLNVVDNSSFGQNLTKIMDTLHEDLQAFLTEYRAYFIKIISEQNQIFKKKKALQKNKHFTFHKPTFP